MAVRVPMPRPKSDSEQINLTLPSAWLEQAAQYAGWLSRPGMTVGRSDACAWPWPRAWSTCAPRPKRPGPSARRSAPKSPSVILCRRRPKSAHF